MLELREFREGDVPLVEAWLHQPHVKKWYEIPHMGVTIDDWMYEIKERNGAFAWLTHLIAVWEDRPIGLCQYYRCADSDGEGFGMLPLAGSYGIDYLIGEPAYLGQGLGKGIIALLVEKIFSFPDAQRVTADIDKDNKASERALLSNHFELWNEKDARYVIEKSKRHVSKAPA